MIQPAILAVDPGGTKCDALLVAADGTLLARCRLRDHKLGGRHPLLIKKAIERVLARQPVKQLIIVMGGRPKPKILPRSFHHRFEWRCCAESMGALAATGQRIGVLVIAGTGARVAVHRTRDRYASLDGLGPVLGDAGSGYYIGREALRAMSRQMQLKQRPTQLRLRILQACRCQNLGELMKFSLMPRDRSLIASLAKIVDEEARAGDPLARRLLRDAARTMADTIRELVNHLGIARESYPFVGSGSVAVRSDIYWRELCREVRRFAPNFKPQRAALPPVAGFAAFGLDDPAAIRKLFATLKKEEAK